MCGDLSIVGIRRSKAVGEGSVGSRGFKVASARKAEVKEVSRRESQ